MKKTRTNIRLICFFAMAVCFNIIGGFLALSLKLPIYLDTIGTIFTALTIGPIGGALVGIATSLINGLSFDPTSFYFLPIQLFIGVSTGLLFKNGEFDGFKSIVAIILVTLLGSIISSVIAALVFGGVTSSGSSLVVAILHNAGVNIVASVFSTQILTDLLDKSIAFGLSFIVIKSLPSIYKQKISHRSSI